MADRSGPPAVPPVYVPVLTDNRRFIKQHALAAAVRVSAVCAKLGTPVYCPVLAHGFPLPFIADSQTVSPVG
jgi:hypothetical protein